MFHDVMLPQFALSFLKPVRKFHQIKSITKSGSVYVNLLNENVKYHYILDNVILSLDQLTEFQNFFYARRSTLHSFLLKDPADYSVTKQYIGKSDGVNKIYKLYKNYHDDITPSKRLIKRPELRSLKIYDESGREITGYSFDFENAKLILSQPILKDKKIFFSCDFYIEVRFMSDSISYKRAKDGSFILDNIEIMEV